MFSIHITTISSVEGHAPLVPRETIENFHTLEEMDQRLMEFIYTANRSLLEGSAISFRLNKNASLMRLQVTYRAGLSTEFIIVTRSMK